MARGRPARRAALELRAAPRDAAAPVRAADPSGNLARTLRRRSLALFGLTAALLVATTAFVLGTYVQQRLATAAIIVGVGLALAGLYALLVDRRHAGRALAVAAAVAGAIATIDQLLGSH